MTDLPPYRVLITSSRNWTDRRPISDQLNQVLADLGPIRPLTVVHGAAPGGDTIAHQWANSMRRLGYRVEPDPHPANWQLHGKRAGHIRNAEMVAAGADLCLAFICPCTRRNCAQVADQPHGSHGATGCAKLARKAGIETRITRWENRYG